MRSTNFIVERANDRFAVHPENSNDLTYRETEGEGIEAAVRMLRNLGFSGEHMTERQADGSVCVWLHNIHGQTTH
jgi:hypothetical protein